MSDIRKEEKIRFKIFHPQWFLKHHVNFLGKDQTHKLLHTNMENSTTYIRINNLKFEEENLKNIIFWHIFKKSKT